jgi:hypothetical protein
MAAPLPQEPEPSNRPAARDRPVAPVADQAEQPAGRRAVAAVEVVPPGKRCGEHILVDRVAAGQGQVHRAGHLGVVGPLPGNRRKRPGRQVVTVAGDEELGSERVTEGEPEKRQPGTLKTIMEHLLLIFAEGCLHVDRQGDRRSIR